MTLPEKLRLVGAVAGMMFLLAGIALDSRLIVWVAIVLLAVSFIIRLYLKKKRTASETSDEEPV